MAHLIDVMIGILLDILSVFRNLFEHLGSHHGQGNMCQIESDNSNRVHPAELTRSLSSSSKFGLFKRECKHVGISIYRIVFKLLEILVGSRKEVLLVRHPTTLAILREAVYSALLDDNSSLKRYQEASTFI